MEARQRQADTVTQKKPFIPVLLGEGELYPAMLKRVFLGEQVWTSCRSHQPVTNPAEWVSGGDAVCSGLPILPLGHPGLWGGPVEPLKPGAIVDGHIRLAAEVGGQSNVAGGDTLAARGNEGLCKVHLLGLEHSSEHLWALLEAILGQEVHERHVERTSDVAWIQSWAGAEDKGKDRVRKTWGWGQRAWRPQSAEAMRIGCFANNVFALP